MCVEKALTNGECYTDDDCTIWATCAYEKPRYFTGTCACKLSEKLTGPRGDYCGKNRKLTGRGGGGGDYCGKYRYANRTQDGGGVHSKDPGGGGGGGGDYRGKTETLKGQGGGGGSYRGKKRLTQRTKGTLLW